MADSQATPENSTEIEQIILDNIQTLITQQKIYKIYCIDDSLSLDHSKDAFKGLIRKLISLDKLREIQAIQLNSFDFTTDQAVLYEHIDQIWENLEPSTIKKYFNNLYRIDGKPEATKDEKSLNRLKQFFSDEQIIFLSPTQWDEQRDQIISSVPDGSKILLLFDYELIYSPGRFSVDDGGINGVDLILELKDQLGVDKVILSILTHTVIEFEEELSERKKICEANTAINSSEFFVLAKKRLQKASMLADGIKKVCLNSYCENIKRKTIDILELAQNKTIEKIKEFDTYDFDHTVFKSSYNEGVSEAETILRITDVIFKDEVRKLMISNNYLLTTNPEICAASDLSKIEFQVDPSINPYKKRFELRHQELFEPGNLVNPLHKPLENGDIFQITTGDNANKNFILVAQECDLMVRSDGSRGARTAILLEIKKFSSDQLFAEVCRKFESDKNKKKVYNHFFADKFKLEYFESGHNNIGLVYFGKSMTVDLNALDLSVFDDNGETTIDLGVTNFEMRNYNAAWQQRYTHLKSFFEEKKSEVEELNNHINCISDEASKERVREYINLNFSFISKLGIRANYENNKFKFGIKRTYRLRQPKSNYLLSRYYQHLSRIAEQHDFAEII